MLLVGLTLGLLFAPRTGRGTRAWIVQKYQHSVNALSRWFEFFAKKVRYQSNRLQGISYELKNVMTQNEGETSDEILPQRVKSELGRFFNVSEIEINSQSGIVTLRGEIGNQQEKQNILDTTRKIKGVREIVDMLY
jgi:osmotically-inducible protein OsmY